MTNAATVAPRIPGLTYLKDLGAGGFAQVYLYEQLAPQMPVAVKVLSAAGMSDQSRAQFAAEANTMAQLSDHPHIVQIFTTGGTADGRPYLVMKYYPKRNLDERSRFERIPLAEVLEIGIHVAGAVETAHRAGIIHRDIKPANILAGRYGEPVLTDFGIAANTRETQDAESDGVSIPWAPPEVLFDGARGDERSDVYSLAATMWHLLAGHSPFLEEGGDNSSWALMKRIRTAPPPRSGRPEVPESFERLLTQAMSKKPEGRPNSALSLARSLQAIQNELRFGRTELVVLADEAEQAQVAADDGADRTSIRLRRVASTAEPMDDRTVRRSAPVNLEPQPPTRTDASRPQRERVGIPVESEAAGTLLRPKTAEPTPAPEVIPVRRVSHQRLVLSAVLAGFIALATATALILGGGQDHTTGQVAVPTTSGTGALDGASPPGAPTVELQRIDGVMAVARWSYQGHEPGDSYFVYVTGEAAQQVSVPHVEIRLPAQGRACATVRVRRVDGLFSEASVERCMAR